MGIYILEIELILSRVRKTTEGFKSVVSVGKKPTGDILLGIVIKELNFSGG